jgi:NAD(P)-dependent dehydrogenase (short-subunit alcohol dehydrogenase family)
MTMLEGKVAFVTGGTGAVGSAILRVLAREGARVAYSFHRNAERARQLDAELAATGTQVRSYALDVLDGAGAAAVAAQIESDLGPLDILVNNAGVTQVMPFALLEEEDWDLVMDVNVKGTFLVTKAFLRGMIRRKRGSIVNIGSLAGMRVLDVPVHYATAKSAIMGFTLSLAREVSRYGIRVNAVVPGMLTEGVSLCVPPKHREQYERYCTLSRVGRPAEVAETVAFLASDRSSYINAQCIFVDGGI